MSNHDHNKICGTRNQLNIVSLLISVYNQSANGMNFLTCFGWSI